MSGVIAKMKLHNVQRFEFGPNPKTNHVKIAMGAVYSNDPNHENKAFADATPSGSLELTIQADKPAAAYFEAGEEYYVTIVKAPKTGH